MDEAVELFKDNPETALFNIKFSEGGLFIVLVCKFDFGNFACLRFPVAQSIENKYHPTSGLMQILHFDWLRY